MGSTRLFIAADVGGTKVAAALMRVSATPGNLAERIPPPQVIARTSAATDVTSEAACLASISTCIDGLMKEAGDVRGIGIGIASLMDFAHGRAVYSMHLPLVDVPVEALLERRHGVPVAVDNDATAACIGEHRYGAGVGCREMLMLTLGTGVGGGIITGGRPCRGAGGSAGELGHVMIDLHGPKCPGNCPNHGCLEAYVSGTAMTTAARQAASDAPASGLGRALAAGEPVDGRLLTQLALAGDDGASELLVRAGEYLGAGLVTLVNIFNPEVVVIGGGAAAAGELLLAPARRVLSERALPPARREVRVLPALLGPDAGLHGAVTLILDRLGGASSL